MNKLKKWGLATICCVGFMLVGVALGLLISQPTVQHEVFAGVADALPPETTAIGTLSADGANFFTNAAAVNSVREKLTLPQLFLGANTAVVAISTETTTLNFFGQPVTLPAAGSGFIVSADGYIVTNDHVIENASRINVMLYDGRTYPARAVNRYRAGDLAVLKIEAENLSFLTFGDSDKIMVGEQVAAIGNPLGELSNSMTVGYISGLDREITVGSLTLNMIQTDASVNRGNSGGPLLNLYGEVIGIVTARAGGTAGGVTVEGLGFAIPSNIAAGIVTRLIENAPEANQQPTQNAPSTPRPIPTPTPQQPNRQPDTDTSTRAANNDWIAVRIYRDAEVRITGVGSEISGLLVDDVLLSINGVVLNWAALSGGLDGLTLVLPIGMVISESPNETAIVRVIRDGTEIDVEVRLTRQ